MYCLKVSAAFRLERVRDSANMMLLLLRCCICCACEHFIKVCDIAMSIMLQANSTLSAAEQQAQKSKAHR